MKISLGELRQVVREVLREAPKKVVKRTVKAPHGEFKRSYCGTCDDQLKNGECVNPTCPDYDEREAFNFPA